MKPVKCYEVATGTTIRELELAVRKGLVEGYQPFGPLVFSTVDGSCQPMVKYDP